MTTTTQLHPLTQYQHALRAIAQAESCGNITKAQALLLAAFARALCYDMLDRRGEVC